MNLSEWIDLKTLKLLAQHTTANGGAAVSFWIISKLIRWTAGVGTFSDGVEYGERFVLAVLLVWFAIEMGKVLWKGRVRFENGGQILSLVV